MLRFHIQTTYLTWGDKNTQEFQWKCYSQNNICLFYSPRSYPRLRNCLNSIKTITRHLYPERFRFVLTEEANKLRKELGEPLYGLSHALRRR